jgi:membrane associated rhomboid family serine protease
MSLQLLFAVVLMVASVLTASAHVMQRPPGWQGWAAVNLLVLVTGAVSLRWLPQWSGLVTAGTYFPLVLAPSKLLNAARRQSVRGTTRATVIYKRLASLLHPTARMRFDAAVTAALAQEPIEQKVAALRALARRATPQQELVLDAQIATVQGDWNAVLDVVRRADEGLRPEFAFLEIRALGETGRLDDMVQAFPKEKIGPVWSQNYFCRLFVLAFAGRLDSVRLLLAQKPSLHSKDYWIAIAAKASGCNEAEWRRVMATFARTTKNESFRRAAQRHLAAMSVPGGTALSSESTAAIDAIEQRLLEQLRKRARPAALVTVILIALVVIGFVAEVSQGGSNDPRTLIQLGALSAPLVLRGEWWRLATTWFLHDGPFHFLVTLNLLLMLGVLVTLNLLLMLGARCEIKAGPLRMLAIYCVGGLASSTAALLMMWNGSAASYFVGSSGGLMAMFGSEVGGLLRDRSYWRKPLNRRRPMSLPRYLLAQTVIIFFLWMDVAFESHSMHLGLAVYAPSFVVGLLINLTAVTPAAHIVEFDRVF